MSDVLKKICNQTSLDLDKRKQNKTLDTLKHSAHEAPKPRGFLNALKQKNKEQKPALIAEIKKASPSKGLIREDFSPKTIAQDYENGGAACLSILTDEPYFQGKMDYLIEARENCTLPVLRKDFMLDPYQVYEARAIGADCILLIMAALDNDTAKELYELSKNLGMDVLIEVHNQEELDRSLLLTPDLLGVNSRNLKTLEVDLKTAHDLSTQIPSDCFKIAESGIYSHADLKSLQTSGYQGFLVGESLMRQYDVSKATKELLGIQIN